MSTLSLIIDFENNCVIFEIKQKNNRNYLVVSEFYGLKKWDSLISALDKKFGEKKILGEDSKHTFRTFEYSNGIWIHTEPMEFLIDIDKCEFNLHNTYDTHNKHNIHTQICTEIINVVESAGYTVNRYEERPKRLAINVPF